jgi:hypothetical protein
MRDAIQIALFDLRRYRMLVYAGFASGLLAVILPFLPTFPALSRGELSGLMAGVGGWLLATVVAVYLGSSYARDLGQRRMSFFFCRPASTLAILGGKILGIVIFIVVILAAIALPSMLIFQSTDFISDWQPRLAIPLVCLFFVMIAAFSHVAGVSLTDRGPWLGVSLISLLASAGIIWIAIQPFRRWLRFSIGVPSPYLVMLGALSILLLLFSTSAFIGIVRGRALLRTVHKATSISLASMLIALALGTLGFGHWLRNSELNDNVIRHIHSVASTKWLIAIGDRMMLQNVFLVDSSTGRGHHLGHSGRIATSARRIAYVGGLETRAPISIIELAGDSSVSRETKIVIDRNSSDHAFAPSGRHLAVLEADVVSVYDLEDQDRLIRSVKIPAAVRVGQIEFEDSETITLLFNRKVMGRVKPFERPVRLIPPSNAEIDRRFFHTSESGRYAVYRSKDHAEGELIVLDRKSGVAILTVPAALTTLAFVEDDRIVQASTAGEHTDWSVYAIPSGSRLRQFRTPRIRVGGAIDRNRFVATGSDPGRRSTVPGRAYVVDVARGTAQELPHVLATPAGLRFARGSEPSVGSLASRLFFDEQQRIVHFDARNGHLRAIGGRPVENTAR